jgi:hypothetical protein
VGFRGKAKAVQNYAARPSFWGMAGMRDIVRRTVFSPQDIAINAPVVAGGSGFFICGKRSAFLGRLIR